MRKSLAVLTTAFLLAACGGGGGGSSSVPGGGVTAPASVSGDMIAYQAYRGWNYQGTISGNPYTFSVYADPPQAGSTIDALVLFMANGTQTTALGGYKAAGLGLNRDGAGNYDATAYILLNANGSVYSSGAIPGSPMLVPGTLTAGQSFTTYPGLTATVQSVGQVPGAGACPTPSTGATVQYTGFGGSYSVSYVPGCGITQYVGNHGEVLTLTSVGSYSSLGNQSVRRMDDLTSLDTIRSAFSVLTSHQVWKPFQH